MAKPQKTDQRETQNSAQTGTDKKPLKPSKGKRQAESPPARSDGTRETVESIVVAFILAFLFRTFEAEAFVIPTGSMAPTLYGRHIEFTCSRCGTHSVVGASSEVDPQSDYYIPRRRILNAMCPNCRYENRILDDNDPNDLGRPVFKGDRILVNKFPYEFWEPQRWDVLVFKFPEDPKTNYIKRLVGLPGEEIQIDWGDVYVRTDSSQPFRIARKSDPNKQRRLQMLVYDNDRPARDLQKWGWPERWAALRKERDEEGRWADDPDGWKADHAARTFQIDETDDEARWLRYRNFVPTPEDWDDLDAGAPLDRTPRPTLVSDYCPYNAYSSRNGAENDRDDVYWVGDLTLNLEVDVRRAEGELLLELVKGAYRYGCQFDLNTGRVTMFDVDEVMPREPAGEEHVLATAETDLNHTGRFEISFANVDRRLCLWIDDELIDFGSKTEYGRPALPAPQPGDLAPVGIAARGSSVEVSHLLIQRDVYYRSDMNAGDGTQNTIYEYGGDSGRNGAGPLRFHELRQLLDDPERWYQQYTSDRHVARFEKLGDDEFFMMGDNSPSSQDSRLWSNTRGAKRRHAVPRSALVGKAFFVYWPHGVPFFNDGRGYGIPVWPLKRFSYHRTGPGQYPQKPYPKFTVPFYPNVFRMHRIR